MTRAMLLGREPRPPGAEHKIVPSNDQGMPRRAGAARIPVAQRFHGHWRPRYLRSARRQGRGEIGFARLSLVSAKARSAGGSAARRRIASSTGAAPSAPTVVRRPIWKWRAARPGWHRLASRAAMRDVKAARSGAMATRPCSRAPPRRAPWRAREGRGLDGRRARLRRCCDFRCGEFHVFRLRGVRRQRCPVAGVGADLRHQRLGFGDQFLAHLARHADQLHESGEALRGGVRPPLLPRHRLASAARRPWLAPLGRRRASR